MQMRARYSSLERMITLGKSSEGIHRLRVPGPERFDRTGFGKDPEQLLLEKAAMSRGTQALGSSPSRLCCSYC